MPDNKLGRDAAQISYEDLKVGSTISDPNYGSLKGYKVDKLFGTTGEGLTAYALRDPKSGDVVIAFRGTNDGKDWGDNVGNLGHRQFEEVAPDLRQYVKNKWSPGTEITFAGHSLGGALAQYAVYDTAGDYAGRRDDMNLVTLNGLGAKNGINENEPGGYDPDQIKGVETSNFYNEEDRVPRLGGDHVGDTFNVGDVTPGEGDGVLVAHSADNFTDKALNGAKSGTPTYYENTVTQMDPETFQEITETLGNLMFNGPEGMTPGEWDNLKTNLTKLTKIKDELPETARLVGDIVEGVGEEAVNWIEKTASDYYDDVAYWAKDKYDSARDWAFDLADDVTDVVTRGLDMAEDAISEGWDTVKETWDATTKWTKDKVKDAKDAIIGAKDTALDWLDDRTDEFTDWADKGIDAIEDWVSDKAESISELSDWVQDQVDEFGNKVSDTWEGLKDLASEKADETLDWLAEKRDNIIRGGKELFEEGKKKVSDAYDTLKDGFRDTTSKVEDWAKDTLDDLSDTRDNIRTGISSLWDDFVDYVNGDDDKPSDYADDVNDRTITARTEASPLVFDLDGDGLELTALKSKGAVYWDIDTDGVRELTGWVKPDDGLLAIDSNRNGEIDDHSELFGTLTVDGFTNLAVLDSNFDQVIDKKDQAFGDLLVWRDLNQDGDSDPGELQKLKAAGITSIRLDASTSTQEIAGHRVSHVSSYTDKSGQTKEISDVWFNYSSLNSRVDGNIPFDPESYTLPQLRGYGQLSDLRSAMAGDAKLKGMVSDISGLSARKLFDPTNDILSAMQDILFRWAGVEKIDPTSRGSYVDARQVAFVEAFTDRPFLQSGRPNPAPEAGRTLTNAFETALNEMMTRVVVQLVGPKIFKGDPTYDWLSDGFESPLKIAFDALDDLAKSLQKSGADMKLVWIELIRVLDTGADIESLSRKQTKQLEKLIGNTDGGSGVTIEDALNTIYPVKGLGLNGTSGDDNLRGGGGRDSLSTGTGNDSLKGLRGDDNLNAGAGDDILDGGTGNDLLLGGPGNDTYIYGSGFDTIVDPSGDDRLIIEKKIDLADMAFLKSPINDDDLEIYASGELIVRIEGYYVGDGTIETLELRDGTIFDLVRQSQGIVGTRKNDKLEGDINQFILSDRIIGKQGNDTLMGKKGADVLEGGPGKDTLKGGDGSDILLGGDGKDILIGGAGNDVSQGGAGNDTYKPEGKETITEISGTDTVELRKGYSAKDVTIFRTALSDDLTIATKKDTILVKDHFKSGGAIEKIAFNKNGKKTVSDLSDLPIETRGTAANDYMRGDEGGVATKDVLRGQDGDDRIYGYDKADVLDGGRGNDYLYGNDGADRMIGGKGDDSAYGGVGGDTYIAGPGDDFVQDAGADGDADDRIILPKDVLKSDVTLSRLLDGDLLVAWDGNTLRVDRAYDSRYKVEKLEYGDGKTVDLPAQSVRTVGTDANDTIYGNREETGSRNDTLNGLGGNDRLYGYDGNDILDGGEGDDSLYGADGGDTYRVGLGDDYISDVGLNDLPDPTDRIVLAGGIKPGKVSYARQASGDLLIMWAAGSVLVDRAFDARYSVETLQFANGTKVDLTKLAAATVGTNGSESIGGNREENGSRNDDIRGLDGDDTLYGYDGNDILDGGAGDDNLQGAEGADTYRVGLGNDLISDYGASDLSDGKDMIVLPAGITPGDVTYTRRSDDDLLIDWGAKGSVWINNAFDERYAVESVKFANGKMVDLTTLSVSTIGTTGAETIYGNRQEFGSRNDTLLGLAGDDRLYGYDGNDILDGGLGDDELYGEIGEDIYRVGDGDDDISDVGASDLSDGKDIIELASGILPGDVTYTRRSNGDLLIDWGPRGSVLVDNAFDERYAVEILKFANGGMVDLTKLTARTEGTNGAESLYGNKQEFGSRHDTLLGLDGNDKLYGYDGNDILDGGMGDDELYGEVGRDTYRVGQGHDYISDVGASDLSDGKDVIELASGILPGDVTYTRRSDDDLLIDFGSKGAVWINSAFDERYAVETLKFADGTVVDLTKLTASTLGTNGSETIYGNRQEFGGRHDTLLGLGGDDKLYGYDGNDILDGGMGDDELYGEVGRDIYRVGHGDDYISDEGASDLSDGRDIIELAAGINPGDVTYTRRSDDDLLIDWGPQGSVWINNAFDERYAVETLKFANGAAVDLTAITARTLGTNGGETLYGNRQEFGGRNDELLGLDGNDTLYGYDGNDRMDGGEGDDRLFGDIGGDIYVVGEGDDYVLDYGAAGDPDDVLQFVSGIQPGDVSYFLVDGTDLRINWSGGSVLVDTWTTALRTVETARFADGTVVDLTTQVLTPFVTPANQNEYGDSGNNTLTGGDGNDRLYGYDGNDILIGGPGNDSHYGSKGTDTYRVGDGHDYIQDAGLASDGNDVVELPVGVAAANTTFYRHTNGDLVIDWGLGSVTIDEGFDLNYAVETLKYANGSTVDLTTLAVPTLGTGGKESLYGNREDNGSRDDDIRGLDGDDTLNGYDGNDILDGGDGNDKANGAEGADTYVVGLGHDFISDVGMSDLSDPKDTIRLISGILPGDVAFSRLNDGDLLIDWTTGSVRVNSAFDARYAVETLRYANGTTVDLTMLAAPTIGTNGKETLYGNREEFGSRNDVIHGLDGDDTLNGYDGNDVLIGGPGDDKLYGERGQDVYRVGEGDDFISDAGASDLSDGKDIIELDAGILPGAVDFSRLGDGDLMITWNNGSVRVNSAFDARYSVETLKYANGTTVDLTMLAVPTLGTNGKETLYGNREEFGSRNDVIRGHDGDDTLYGYDGNDVLIGGPGNDNLYGEVGRDIYRVGEGNDYISDVGASDLSDGKDIIELDAGILPNAVNYSRLTDGDLMIDWNTGSVRVNAAFDARYAVETLEYANGTTVDLTTLAVPTFGTNKKESLYGNREEFGSRADVLFGLDGDDTLYGYDGNDILVGGRGDDSLNGEVGRDIYRVGEGDDHISDYGAADLSDGNDVIELDSGIAPRDVSYSRLNDGDLMLNWGTGSVRINNAFDARYAVERLKFANGKAIDLLAQDAPTIGTGGSETLSGNREEYGSRDDDIRGQDGSDRLYGYDGNDILNGGLGDDFLFGAADDDTYVVSRGVDVLDDGRSASDDTILFSQVSSAAGLTMTRSGSYDLSIGWKHGEVILKNQYYASDYQFETIIFSDGSSMDLDI